MPRIVDRLRIDVLFALRALRRAPSTTFCAIVTLAAAAGLNLAMFGLIDRAILSPPSSVSHADRVFTLAFERDVENGARAAMTTTSYPTFDAIRRQLPAGQQVAAWQPLNINALVDGAPVNADAMLVSGSYFQLLGTRPLLGRGILPDDDMAPVGSPVVVLSHALWRGTFGGDRDVLSRRLNIRGVEFSVAGVMPAGFSGHSSAKVDLWVPFYAAMQQSPGWDRDVYRNFLSVIVRASEESNPATIAAQATTAIESVARRVTLSPIVGGVAARSEQQIAFWLTGVSVLVLIIGLANTATLLLVRGVGRRRDLAIRTALGASRARLQVQLMIESAILAVIAIGAALVLSHWVDDGVRSVLLPSVIQSAGLSLRTLGVAAITGCLAFVFAAVAGIAQMPAYLRDGDLAGATAGRPRRRAHTALLLVQTTLSVVLLAGAGLFGRSLFNLVSQDFGMRTDDVLLVEFDRSPGAPQERSQLLASAIERVRGLAGVELATVIQMIPFTGFHVIPIEVPGFAGRPNVNGQLPYLLAATPELLEILDVTMVEGRRFVAADERGAPVVIVNETMARTIWPGTRALGKCIRIGFEPSFNPFTATGPPPPLTTVPCREVIGVARDVRQRSVVPTGREAGLMQYYVPFEQVPAGFGEGPGIQGLLLRASVGPEALAAPIRSIIVDGRADLPFLRVRRYSELLERQMRPWRQGTALLSLFGVLALGVAAVGLYAAFAHLVSERRPEMAIRLAIGARNGRVLVMILREGITVAAIGVVCGCLVAVAAGRWVQSMLFGTAPSDPLVLGSAALLMLVVATLATFLPARSASRSDPTLLLRAE